MNWFVDVRLLISTSFQITYFVKSSVLRGVRVERPMWSEFYISTWWIIRVYAVTAETSSVLVLQWKIWYFITLTPQVLLVVCSYPSCVCSSAEMTYEVYSEFLLSSSCSRYPDPCADKAYMALFLKRKSDMCSPQYNYTGISFCDYSGCVNCLKYLIWLCCSDISSVVGSRVDNYYHHCSLVLYFFNFWPTEVTVWAF